MLIYMDLVEMIPAAFAADDEQTLTIDDIDQIHWHPLEFARHFCRLLTSSTYSLTSSTVVHPSSFMAALTRSKMFSGFGTMVFSRAKSWAVPPISCQSAWTFFRRTALASSTVTSVGFAAGVAGP